MSAQETLDRIRRFAASRKLRSATLARAAGLHPNALRDMHKPTWRPRFDTVDKLEKAIMALKAEKSAA